METLRILEMAINFRAAIESIPLEDRPYGMQKFPSRACGDTARLFGAFLVDHDIPGFKYISGVRSHGCDDTWASHAWLQRDDLAVDLTADQFSDAPSGIIVSAPSPWHQNFQAEPGSDSDFRCENDYGSEILYPIYQEIVREILKYRPSGF